MRGHRSVRGRFPTMTWRPIVASLAFAAIVAAPARPAEPDRSPRSCIPAKGLLAYVEYDGLDAHTRAWQATAAHDLLVEDPGRVHGDSTSIKQLTGDWLQEDLAVLATVPEVMTIAEVMVLKGFACGIVEDEAASHCMLVLKDIGRAEYLKRLAHVRDVFNASPSVLFAEIERMSVRGRTIYRLDGDPVSVWCEGNDLVLVCTLPSFSAHAANAQAGDVQLLRAHKRHIGNVLNCVEGKQLGASRHPAYLSARAEGKDLKGFEPSGLWFVDTARRYGVIRPSGGWRWSSSSNRDTPGGPREVPGGPAENGQVNAGGDERRRRGRGVSAGHE